MHLEIYERLPKRDTSSIFEHWNLPFQALHILKNVGQLVIGY